MASRHPLAVRYALQYLWKPGAIAQSLGREVTAGIKGLQVRCQKYIVGPAATPGQHLGSTHINLVEIGALFAVDLDIHEPLVHQFGDFGV